MSTITTLASLQELAELINSARILNKSIIYTESQISEYPHMKNQLDTLELESAIFIDKFNYYMTDEVKDSIRTLIENK